MTVGRLQEFNINKADEFIVNGEVKLGTFFDEMTLRVFRLQENGGRGDLVETYTHRYPAVTPGTVHGKAVRKARQQMLLRTFMAFEKKNSHGILFV